MLSLRDERLLNHNFNRTIAILPFHISAFFFNPNGDVPSLKFKIVLSLLAAVIVFVNASTDLACRYALGFDLIADMTLRCGGEVLAHF